MATLSQQDQMTPIEVARRFGSKDSILMIEAIEETNEMLMDAYTTQASDGTVNTTVQRTAYAEPSRRNYGEGVGGGSSITRKIEDRIIMIEQYSDVDADMADHSPSTKELLRSEDVGVLERMGQVQAQAFIYDQASDGNKYIDGFFVRLGDEIDEDALFSATAEASIDEDGDYASILLMKWAADKAQIFFPRGEPGVGCQREYRGKVDSSVLDSGVLKKMPVYSTFFKSHLGVSIRHPKAAKRVANIDPTTLTEDNAKAVAIQLKRAYNKLPKGAGTVVAYMNSDVMTLFDLYSQILRTNYFFTKGDPWGRPTSYLFQEQVRVRRIDEMLSTESPIAFPA